MSYSQKIRTLFLPGVATFAAQLALWSGFVALGMSPKTLWRETTFSFSYYAAFWLGFVLIGALGASLSRRAGGSTRERLLAAEALVIGKIIGYTILMPFAIATAGWSSLTFVYGGITFVFVKYIVAPGCALLVGALPFLSNKE